MLSGISFSYEQPEKLSSIPLHVLRAYARSRVPQATIPAFVGQEVSKDELTRYTAQIKTFDWFAVTEYLMERHASSQYITGYSLLRSEEVEELMYVDDEYNVIDGELAYVGADVDVLPYNSFEEECQRQVLLFQQRKMAEQLKESDKKRQEEAKVPVVVVNHDNEIAALKLEWTQEDQKAMWRQRVLEFELEAKTLMADVQSKVVQKKPAVKVVMGVPVPKSKPVIVQYAHAVSEFPFYFMQINAQDTKQPRVDLNTSESYMEAIKYCVQVNRDDLMGMKQHIERVLDELVKQGIEFENNSAANYYLFIGYLFSDDRVVVSFAAAISKILEKRWVSYNLFQKVPVSWGKNAVMWCKPKPLTTINPSWLEDYSKYTNFALRCAAARGKGEALSDKIYRLPHADARIQGVLEDAMSLHRKTREVIIIVSTDSASLARLGWAIFINQVHGVKVFMSPQKGVNEVLNCCIAKVMTEGIAFDYQSTTVSNLQVKKLSTLAEQWTTIMDQHRNYFGMKPIRTAGKIVSHYFPSVMGVEYAMSHNPADGSVLWVKTHEIGEVEFLVDQKMAFSVHRERYLRVSNVKTQFSACRTRYAARPTLRCGPPVMMSMDIPELLADDEEADEILFEDALEDVRKKPAIKPSVARPDAINLDGVTPWPGRPRRQIKNEEEESLTEPLIIVKDIRDVPRSILRNDASQVKEVKQVRIAQEVVKTEDMPVFDDAPDDDG